MVVTVHSDSHDYSIAQITSLLYGISLSPDIKHQQGSTTGNYAKRNSRNWHKMLEVK
jgi:hypothetical protein